MKTQQDHQERVVALVNLEAMCERASGTARQHYVITKVSRSRVHVTVDAIADEWGTSENVTAVFPCYPSGWDGDADNPRVVLDAIRITGASSLYDPIQEFWPLLECEQLWRSPDDNSWATRDEIEAKK